MRPLGAKKIQIAGSRSGGGGEGRREHHPPTVNEPSLPNGMWKRQSGYFLPASHTLKSALGAAWSDTSILPP